MHAPPPGENIGGGKNGGWACRDWFVPENIDAQKKTDGETLKTQATTFHHLLPA